jgi:nucleoside-diphosphate-sugar epimerase
MALARRLTELGVGVRVLDQRQRAWIGVPHEYIAGDVADGAVVRRAAQGVQVIYNLAALQPVSRAGTDFARVNSGGTQNVLEAALAEGRAHVVHLSSSIVYGVPRGRRFQEDDPLRPVGRYGESKVAGEERCRAARSRGLTVTIVRPRVIVGPGRLGLFWILFEWIRQGRRIYLIGSGENRFQMCDSSDLANACVLAAERRVDDTLNVGSDEVPRVRDALVQLIQHAGSRSKLTPLPAPLARMALRTLDRLGLAPLTAEHYLFADKDFLLDTSRAKRRLGWSPLVGDAEALCSAYDFYCAQGSRMPHDYAHDRPALGALELLRRFS